MLFIQSEVRDVVIDANFRLILNVEMLRTVCFYNNDVGNLLPE
jgi:hypothetical protein